ncbi:hypothetical protein [Quadrisphaera setariae]|uniref:Uncharacterized protein n=1 Tax=Quadrisphaera setariae TaxID=2593304 RepID=A0A5C8ZG18_9ACTN|nr:hypothetical protein [Quadrisphaera setariae]TXR56474.1 hypothetical protein FMM08_10325 [Quadrisphaera setariae]
MTTTTPVGEAGRALLRALEPLATTEHERARVLCAALGADEVADAERWARARRAEHWSEQR